jgi:hypothetical protein
LRASLWQKEEAKRKMENHAKNEKVLLISLSLVDDFPEHPFMVKNQTSPFRCEIVIKRGK